MKNKAASWESRRLAAGDISIFCEQLALVLESGLTIVDGLSAVQETLENEKAKEAVRGIEAAVASGTPFSKALDDSGLFPKYMSNMVEIGEKTGNLDDVLKSLNEYYERERLLKQNVRNALLYPLILVLMMSAVIAVLIIKVLPIFQKVFAGLGSVSAGTALLMSTGVTIAKCAFVLILLFAAALVVFLIINQTQKGSVSLSRISSKFGPLRKVSAKITSARFAAVLSMALSSGYNLEDSLELVQNVLESGPVTDKVSRIQKQMAEGTGFAEAVRKEELFPGIHGRMIQLGDKTGRLDTVMQKLATEYDQEAQKTIHNTVAILEPVLIGVLVFIIGAILLAIMFPLMGIISSIG